MSVGKSFVTSYKCQRYVERPYSVIILSFVYMCVRVSFIESSIANVLMQQYDGNVRGLRALIRTDSALPHPRRATGGAYRNKPLANQYGTVSQEIIYSDTEMVTVVGGEAGLAPSASSWRP